MKILMLSCRKATELVEKKAIVGLKHFEQLQLFIHTNMCDACKLYERQSQFLDLVLRSHSAEPDDKRQPEKKLPDEVKSKIIRKIEHS